MNEERTVADILDHTPSAVKFRVNATVRVVNDKQVEVTMHIRLHPSGHWLDLVEGCYPLLVSRRFSGKNGDREAMELYAVAALKHQLKADGASCLRLDGGERHQGGGIVQYRYWAVMSAPFSVAVRTRADGSVALLGLA